jgi:hypothetical protein
MTAVGSRVLLDNCVPRRFAPLIEGHTIASVIELGWAGLKDGELLDRMANEYGVLITVDRGIRPIPSWCCEHGPTALPTCFPLFRRCLIY